MEHLYSRFRFIHIMDYFLPGCFLTAIIYIILPSTIKLQMPDNTFLFIILFFVCSGFIGVLNHNLSFRIVNIYKDGSLKVMFSKIGEQLKKIGAFFVKTFTTEEEEDVTSDFLLKDEFINEEEKIDVEAQPKKKQRSKLQKILHKLGKKLKKIQLFKDDGKNLVLRAENEEILTYLKENVLSDYVKECADDEIYDYICLYLQGKSMKNRLAEFIAVKGINRNLSSASILCAFLFLFVSMPGNFTIQILLKLIMFVLFIVMGDIFYREYLILIDRVNHNILIWFMEIIQK